MGYRTTRPHATLRACRIRWYAVALAVLTWLAGAPILAQTGTAQVDRVIDGDTISVRLDGERLRRTIETIIDLIGDPEGIPDQEPRR